MKFSIFTLFLFLGISIQVSAQQQHYAVKPEFVPGEVIVQCKAGYVPNEQLQEYGIVSSKAICKDTEGKTSFYLLSFSSEIETRAMVATLKGTGLFAFVEGNGYMEAAYTPNDPKFTQQYGLNNTGSFNLTFATADSDADVKEAWDIEMGDSATIVAVLDGGIALNHPEFAGRIWHNLAEIPNNGTDDDGNGYIDDYEGWNFAYGTKDVSDDLGHGTASAGVIGANPDNNLGTAGIDWYCKMMVLKVLDSTNFGTYDEIAEAIYYASNMQAPIMNMSFAGGYSSLMDSAILYAWNHGAAMFAATGNSNDSIPWFPSADSLVFAVGGSNAWDVRYIYSNYGTHMDVVAAGDYIYIVNYEDYLNDSTFASGTSLAAPFVSGVAALLKAQNHWRPNYVLYDILRLTAEDQVDQYTGEDTPGWDKYFGYGRVNANLALLYDTTQIATGIAAQTANAFEVNLYPNPGTGKFILSTSNFSSNSGEISIFASSGNCVYQSSVSSSGKTLLDLQHLPNGIYFVKVGTAETYTTRKLVLNRN